MDSTRISTLRQRINALTDSALQSEVRPELGAIAAELEREAGELQRRQHLADRAAELFARAPVGLLGLDSSLRITEANATAAELLRVSPAQLVGVTLGQLLLPSELPRWAAFLESPAPAEFAFRGPGGDPLPTGVRIVKLSDGSAVLSLEVLGATPAMAPPPPRTSSPSATAAPFRVLLVEDEPIVRKSLGRQLKHLGLDVVAVGSGPEAMAAAETQVFQAVLSDLAMPGMDGVSLARHLRQRHPSLPIIIMSGNVPEDLQPQLLALNLGRLDKPFGEGELRMALEQLTPKG